MIPKVRLPDSFHDKARSAFERGRKERKLRLLIDAGKLDPSAHRELLEGFTYVPDVASWTLLPFGRAHLIEVESPLQPEDVVPYSYPHETGKTLSAVWPFSNRLALARNIATRHGTELSDTLRAYLLASIAEDRNVDALVTNDPLLLENRNAGLLRDANPMTVDEALSLVGLFLRTRDDFTTRAGDHYSDGLNRGLFYWVLTRSLLPAGWKWFSACYAAAKAAGDDTLANLGEAALRRVDQGLRARDRLHEQTQVPQHNDTADEELFYFDILLLTFSGAFDAVARVADIRYGVSKNFEMASWRKTEWLTKLRSCASPLADLMWPESPGGDALEILATLRNSIHGEPLRSIAFQDGSQPIETLVIVPPRLRQRFLDVVRRRGTMDEWGVRDLDAEYLCVDPAPFVEELVPRACETLSTIMELTDIESMPGIDPGQVMLGPPHDDIFGPGRTFAVRALSGL